MRIALKERQKEIKYSELSLINCTRDSRLKKKIGIAIFIYFTISLLFINNNNALNNINMRNNKKKVHFNCALSHSPCCTFFITSASQDSSLYLLYLYFLSLLLILFIIYIFTSTSLCRFSYMQSPLFNSALEPSSCTSFFKGFFFIT